MNLTGVDAPEQIQMVQVPPIISGSSATGSSRGSSAYHRRGRPPNGGHFAILSDTFWQRSFGGAPMLGKTVSLNGTPYTVVGIMFSGRGNGDATPVDAWVPFQIDPASADQSHYFTVAARIRPSVTHGHDQGAASTRYRRIPTPMAGVSTTLPGVTFIAEPIKEVMDRNIRPSLVDYRGGGQFSCC